MLLEVGVFLTVLAMVERHCCKRVGALQLKKKLMNNSMHLVAEIPIFCVIHQLNGYSFGWLVLQLHNYIS